MMTELEYEEATEMEASWAVRGGAILVIAFLCPLVLPNGALWFTDLVGGQSIAGVRVIVLAPAVAGVIALFAGYMLRGLSRPMTLLLTAGLCNVLILGVSDAYARALTSMADRIPPELLSGAVRTPATLLLMQVSVTLMFVGLAYTRLRPLARSGPLLAGGAGVGTVVLMVAPLDGVALRLIFDGNMWSHAWFVPVTMVLAVAFAAVCICLFLGLGEAEDMATLGLILGVAVLLMPGLGILVLTLKVGGLVVLTGLTLTLKLWGTFVALHILFAAGMLGWLVHGVQPE